MKSNSTFEYPGQGPHWQQGWQDSQVMLAAFVVVMKVLWVITNLSQFDEYPAQEQHWQQGWQVSQVREIGEHEQPCCLVGSLHLLGQCIFVKIIATGPGEKEEPCSQAHLHHLLIIIIHSYSPG